MCIGLCPWVQYSEPPRNVSGRTGQLLKTTTPSPPHGETVKSVAKRALKNTAGATALGALGGFIVGACFAQKAGIVAMLAAAGIASGGTALIALVVIGLINLLMLGLWLIYRTYKENYCQVKQS